MSRFVESQNFIIVIGAGGMIISSILACCYKMKIKECIIGCIRISRDVSAENLELQIETRTGRDVIPQVSLPINPMSLLPITRRSASMV